MAEGKRLGSGQQLDINQLVLEAQNRWLRPAEICEILKNHSMFGIESEAPNKPPGGKFYLFDRRTLRYFRRDNHNWQKKKDGKTIKEAHEKLKDGSIDVLHCYYAHGEDDENFQRRSYWMLDEDWTHLVFVHYLKVKGSKASSSRTKYVHQTPCIAQDDSPSVSNSRPVYNHMVSMDSGSPHSGQSTEYEDAKTDKYQASPGYNLVSAVPWDDVKCVADASYLEPYIPITLQDGPGDLSGYKDAASDFISLAQENGTLYPDIGASAYNLASTSTDLMLDMTSRHPSVGYQSTSYISDMFAYADFATDRREAFFNDYSTEEIISKNGAISIQDLTDNQITQSGTGSLGEYEGDMDTLHSVPLTIGKSKTTFAKQLSMEFPILEGDAGLKKYDSFSRWTSKALGPIDDSCMQSGSGIGWDEVENDSVLEDSGMSKISPLDPYVLSPSVSQNQLFSIIDFSPYSVYAGLQTRVVVTGTFLISEWDIGRYQWSCMFGEVEVPAMVIADGTLQCDAPLHRAGVVPFYVTCSNRLACSEVREFEYVFNPSQSMENSDLITGSSDEMLLFMRFMKMVSPEDSELSEPTPDSFGEHAFICRKVCSLLRDVEGYQPSLLNRSNIGVKDQNILKGKLCVWLLHKIIENENGASVLDADGQCIIHLAAALDYGWAMKPIVAAGVGINFRDVLGWTALHWAAYYGREQTVMVLMSLGAAPGLLTDPTSEFTSGRTPADLASSQGHKGIAGFLAESSLTSHLSTLTFKDPMQSNVVDRTEATGGDANWNSVNFHEGNTGDDFSMKDSLSAVRTATQAAARIHMAFRMQSFHRKKVIEYEDDEAVHGSDLSDEHLLSRLAVKSNKKSRNADTLHAAATKIQNKYRGYKGRQEYLIIRKRIINIQAHVRGYQVRKRKKIYWTIGIVQKALLWRRRGRGSHHAQSEMPLDAPSTSSDAPSTSLPPASDNDQDLLKVGRKQSEVRLNRALERVKSMVQYPEARDQYRRLRTGVEEYKSKATLESIINDPPESIDMYMLDEIQELLGDDTEMPLD